MSCCIPTAIDLVFPHFQELALYLYYSEGSAKYATSLGKKKINIYIFNISSEKNIIDFLEFVSYCWEFFL